MIIFNLWAIPVGILVYAVLAGLRWLHPPLVEGPHEFLAIGIVMTLVGGIADYVGLRARVFFLPFWLIGIGMICYDVGWVGMIIFVAVAAAGLVLLMRRAAKKEAEEFRKAQQELLKMPAPVPRATELQFWQWVQTMLYLPSQVDYTPDVCEHNIKVLQTMMSADPLLAQEEAAKLAFLVGFLQKSKIAPKPASIDYKLRNDINSLVEARVKKANPNARLPTKADPPPLIAKG